MRHARSLRLIGWDLLLSPRMRHTDYGLKNKFTHVTYIKLIEHAQVSEY